MSAGKYSADAYVPPKDLPFHKKCLRFIRRPVLEKKRILASFIKPLSTILFFTGKSTFVSVFCSYLPDSHVHFYAHPEFRPLLKRFTKRNRYTNSGDIMRLWSFLLNIKQVISDGVEGNFAELGVWKGNTASILAHFAAASNRRVYLFDTYEGFDKRDLGGIDADKPLVFSDTSLDIVKDTIGKNSEACEFVKGFFPDSVSDVHEKEKYAVVSLDCDLYEPMKAGLDFFYPRMPKGGLLLLHDYSSLFWEGSKKAIDEFCQETNEYLILMPDKSGSAFIRKSQ